MKESLFPIDGVITVVFLLGFSYAIIFMAGGFEDYLINISNMCQEYYYDKWY